MILQAIFPVVAKQFPQIQMLFGPALKNIAPDLDKCSFRLKT